MRLIKDKSGVIFDYDCSYIPETVTVAGGEVSVLDGINIPDGVTFTLDGLRGVKEYVLDIQNTFNPVEAGQCGGVDVRINEIEFVKLEEYYDEAKGIAVTYPYLRLVRHYTSFTAYWSDDGIVWHLVGSIALMGEPAVSLYAQGASLNVNRVRAVANSKLTLTGIPVGAAVSMQYLEDTYHRDSVSYLDSVQFDVPSPYVDIPVTIEVTVGEDVFTNEVTVSGGDTFDFNVDPKLYYEKLGVFLPVSEANKTSLGRLTSLGVDYTGGNRALKMKVENVLSVPVMDVIVNVAEVDANSNAAGYVGVCYDNSGAPTSPSPFIEFPILEGGASEVFWLILNKSPESGQVIREVEFNLVVEATV